MFIFNGVILGLGLFFLGLQLTGQNMRALSGGGFRQLVRGATGTPWLSGVCGLVAGALMQSATAVTFILVSMVGSGLIKSASARVIVVWCNVGLTALAFLAAFNIHPIVAFVVGVAGIAMGSVRRKPWNTIAGAVLGVGIILFGLEQLGAGLAPLKDEAWFRQAIEVALSSPLQAFGIGIAAAALLQSNTGAAMVLITLAAGGAFEVAEAAPAIYGTNLGAIALRAFLARGLSGSAIRLVRMEDLFCAFSGLLMMALFFLERAGIPLVQAFVNSLHGGDAMRLAAVFLLSNLIPALVLSPFLSHCESLLKRVWPSDAAERPGEPKFLRSQALADPETALDLIPKELGRLFGSLSLENKLSVTDSDSHEMPSFIQLGAAIEVFCVRLASENPLSQNQSLRLQRCRAWLHTIRHIGEASGELAASRAALPPSAEPCAKGLLDWVRANILLGAEATASMDPQKIQEFFESSKQKVPAVRAMRKSFLESCGEFSPAGNLEMSSLVDNFDITAWLIHRLSKLQVKAIQAAPGAVGF
jgi:phosphate:Na+ symporter